MDPGPTLIIKCTAIMWNNSTKMEANILAIFTMEWEMDQASFTIGMEVSTMACGKTTWWMGRANFIMTMANWLMKGNGIETNFTEGVRYTMIMPNNWLHLSIIGTFRILSNIGNTIRVFLLLFKVNFPMIQK